MPEFALPLDTECTCRRGDTMDAVTGHALGCPTHSALMVELFKPMPKSSISDNRLPPAAPPNINWRVHMPPVFKSVSPNVGEIRADYLDFYAPHCNADAQGLLAVGGPGEVLAIFAPGEWSRIENLDAKGVDGVTRVRAV